MDQDNLSFQAVLNATLESVFLVKGDGEIISANNIGAQRLGVKDPRDIVGKKVFDFFPPENIESRRKYGKKVVEKKTPFEFIDFRNGKYFKSRLFPVIVNNQEVNEIAVFSMDITTEVEAQNKKENYTLELEQKVRARTSSLQKLNTQLTNQKNVLEKTIRELQDTQQKLIETEKMVSLGVLMAGVAHEINNPLQLIYGGVGLLNKLEDDHKMNGEAIEHAVESINVGIQRALKIVNSLNYFSRNSDKYDEPCDLEMIFENSLCMIHNEFMDKVQVTNKIKGKTILVKGNLNKLHQVMLNVLLNAAQSIKKKGKVEINAEELDGIVSINISDTGTGIQKQEITKIFDSFYTTKEAGIGTGLGLSIASEIIKNHCGSIEIKSQWRKGSTVIIKLQKA